jgi:hypothetical protein
LAWPLLHALAVVTLASSVCLTLVSVPPYSFSFTFPRPPVIFNSVIMTYSVGTWCSLSPTLHSHPWISWDQHSFPEPPGQDRLYTATRCHSPALIVSLASCPPRGSKGGAEDGGHRESPRPSGRCCWAVWVGVSQGTAQNSFTL